MHMKNMKTSQKNKIEIQVDNNIDIANTFNFSLNTLSNKIINYVILYFNLKYTFLVELRITNNRKIRYINKKYRNIDKSTDVISFPNFEFYKPLYFKDLIIGDTIFLGDIVISIDKVLYQSRLYGHSIKREYSFLLIHSLLHLLGFDHNNNSEEKKMFDIQKDILNGLSINK